MTTLGKRLRKTGRVIKDACLIWFKLRHHYAWHYKHSKIHDNWIIFESFHGKNISDSPLYMCREFLNDPSSKGFKIFYSTDHKRDHKKLVKALGLPITLVPIKSYRYMRCLAQCKYLVNNSSFPSYFIRKPEQRYIQIWHGTPLKTLGKQMRMGIESMYNVQHNFLQANFITYPNEYMREIMMRDYNLEDLYTGKVAMLGYPRNAIFFNAQKAKEIRTKYAIEGMEVFAYMPTWRGASNHDVDVEGYREQILHYFSQLDAKLKPNQRIYVNFHSMVSARMGDLDFEHIFSFPSDIDNYEFLNACDALITDYSSVFFDYSLTRKPIILFVYDERDYLRERGMYLDLDSLPFPKVRTAEELGNMLVSGAFRNFVYEGSEYEKVYLSNDSPDNSRRALSLLFEGAANGVEIFDYSKNEAKQWRIIEPAKQNTVDDIETICQAIDPRRDICVFLKSKFNRDKSAHLHDFHRDEFTFIFINKAIACTPLEVIACRFSKKTKNALAERERQRCLPGIKASQTPQTDIYLGTAGTTVISEEPHLLNATAAVNSGKLQVNFTPVEAESCDFRNLVVVQGRRIVWRRPLSNGERASRSFAENFDGLYDTGELISGRRFLVCLDAIDRATKSPVVFELHMRDSPVIYPDDKMRSYAEPLLRDPSSLTPQERELCKPYLDSALEGDGSPALVPYSSVTGNLSLLADFQNAYLRRIKSAPLCSIKACRGNIHMRARVRSGNFEIVDVVLKLRNTVDPVELSLPFVYRKSLKWGSLDIDFDPEKLPLQEIYWDLYAIIKTEHATGRMQLSLSKLQLLEFCMRNIQSRVGNDDVLFPFVTKGKKVAFTYRDYYPVYDVASIRFKEFAALLVYGVLRPYWKNKRIWLVYEKFCHLAQDNAYYFFKYCMDDVPEPENRHVYYVIDKAQPDFENIGEYDAQVIQHMSFKHMLYSLSANIYIASDSRSHLYLWRPKPSAIAYLIRRHQIFFLQHGVTALKRVDNLFGKKGSSPMTYFLTTSENEQKIVLENFGYDLLHAPILGFSRWDVLQDRSTKKHPEILLMPTWRPWLEEQDAKTFIESDYFKAYSSFIQSSDLSELLEKYDARLRFYIHPKLADQLKNFSTQNSRVELIPQGSEPLNRIMMECNAIITDYSSVCWDMLYMDKPVVYYQFDQELYESVTGSYVDLNRGLPGDVCKTEKELISALDRCAKRGFTMTPEQIGRAKGWFENKDTANRARTYKFLVNRGY